MNTYVYLILLEVEVKNKINTLRSYFGKEVTKEKA